MKAFAPGKHSARMTGESPVAGLAVIEVPSLEEAIEWDKRFRKIVGEGESESVPLLGPHDFDQE